MEAYAHPHSYPHHHPHKDFSVAADVALYLIFAAVVVAGFLVVKKVIKYRSKG